MPSSGRSLLRRLHVLGEHLRDDGQVVVGPEGDLAGEALVEHHAHGPDVGARVDVLAAAGLLGRHVKRRAQHHAGAGEAHQIGRRRRATCTALDTPKSTTLTKSCSPRRSRKTFSGLTSRWTMPLPWAAPSALATWRAMRRQRSTASGRVAHHHLGQRLALQELHHDEGPPVGRGAEVGDVDDVLVADGAGQPRLLQQARDQLGLVVELLEQHLDRHRPPEHRVPRLVHRPHAALADAADDLVAVGQHRTQQRVGGRSSGPGAGTVTPTFVAAGSSSGEAMVVSRVYYRGRALRERAQPHIRQSGGGCPGTICGGRGGCPEPTPRASVDAPTCRISRSPTPSWPTRAG